MNAIIFLVATTCFLVAVIYVFGVMWGELGDEDECTEEWPTERNSRDET